MTHTSDLKSLQTQLIKERIQDSFMQDRPSQTLAEAIELLKNEIKALNDSNTQANQGLIENLTKVLKMLSKVLQRMDEHDYAGSIVVHGGGFDSEGVAIKLHEAEEDLKRTKEELARTKKDLDSTRNELDRTNEAVDKTNKKLIETQDRLEKTQKDLRAAQDESADQKRKIENMQADHSRKLENMEMNQKTLKKENHELRKEIETIKDRLSATDVMFANLNNENNETKETQILGDFAYQIQKVLALIFGRNGQMTGKQLMYLYKNNLDEKSKAKLDLLGLKNRDQVEQLSDALESLKDSRFDSAHYAIANCIDCTPGKLKTLARKHGFDGETIELLKFWDIALKKGKIFDQSTWELHEKL